MGDRKKCPGGKCEKCYLYRRFTYKVEAKDPETGKMMETGEIAIYWRCAIDHLLLAIPKIYGSIDGVQEAANEARNRAMETRETIRQLGAGLVAALNEIERAKRIG